MTGEDIQRLWEQIERIATAQERIATVLEMLVDSPQEPPTPASEEPPMCPHPTDQRIDFGMTNGQPDWQCKVCGFRTVAE